MRAAPPPPPPPHPPRQVLEHSGAGAHSVINDLKNDLLASIYPDWPYHAARGAGPTQGPQWDATLYEHIYRLAPYYHVVLRSQTQRQHTRGARSATLLRLLDRCAEAATTAELCRCRHFVRERPPDSLPPSPPPPKSFA